MAHAALLLLNPAKVQKRTLQSVQQCCGIKPTFDTLLHLLHSLSESERLTREVLFLIKLMIVRRKIFAFKAMAICSVLFVNGTNFRLTAQPSATSPAFVGSWNWTDTASDGSSYSGTMTISQAAANGSLAWTWAATYSGTGMSTGSTLTLDGAAPEVDLTARWVGMLDPTGRRIDGTWTQSDGQVGTFTATAAPGPPAPTVMITPMSITFGSAPLSKTKTQRLIIQNTGAPGSTLTGTVNTPLPPFSITLGAGSFSLAAGASMQVDVQFQPTATGPLSDAIVITSNDPVTPSLSVPLSGTGSNLTTVTVWIDAFIPYADFGPLSLLPEVFLFVDPTFLLASSVDGAGDGRSFAPSADVKTAPYRIQWLQTFDAQTLVPTCPAPCLGSVQPSHLLSHATGEVIATGPTSNSGVIVGQPQQVGSLVYVSMSGGAQPGFLQNNPVAELVTPAINANVTFQIDLVNRTCQIVGTHGLFPAFEAYIQGDDDPPATLWQHNVGPAIAWYIFMQGLFFPNAVTVGGTPVPF